MLQMVQSSAAVNTIREWLSTHPGWAQVIGLLVLGLLAYVGYVAAKRLLLAVVTRMVRGSSVEWDDRMLEAGVFRRLAYLAPVLAIYWGLQLVPGLPPGFVNGVERVGLVALAIVLLLAVGALLSAVQAIYDASRLADGRPIKGHIQLAKLFIYLLGGVVILATLTGRSPLGLLGGIGAMTAVVLLIFRDTILSFVASLQLSSYDMVRLGDWIEMPAFGADGDVIDIALHTVKVQNWDKTITTIPTHKLISESFKNWRGMKESGGRRIKRAFYLDMTSIRFLEQSDIDRFERFELLEDYVKAKREKLAEYNATQVGDAEIVSNVKRLTNIGTLRAYLAEYLRHHPRVNDDMTLIVRQLEPTAHGLPLQVYCFSSDTRWAPYESLQSDIFDHILAIVPQFDLRVFQSPTGQDLTGALGGRIAGDSKA